MRMLPCLSGACCGAALLISGCTEPPPPTTDTAVKAPAEAGPKIVSIDAGAGGPKRAQTALDQRQAGRCDRARRGAVRLHLDPLARRQPRDAAGQGSRQDHPELQEPGGGHRAARGCSSPARRMSPSPTSPSKMPAVMGSRPTARSGSSFATSAPSGPAGPKRPTAATESIPCSARTC